MVCKPESYWVGFCILW